MPSFPADSFGNPIPCLAPTYGSSQENAVTTSNAAPSVGINAAGVGCIVRVMAIGCDCFYRAGTGATAPTLVDGLVFSGQFLDVPMTPAQTHMWMRARSGSGVGRVELIG